MRCPRCDKVLRSPARDCPNCGYMFNKALFEKLVVYFDLKSQFDYLNTLNGYYRSSLDKVGTRLNEFQRFLEVDIRHAAAMEKREAAKREIHPAEPSPPEEAAATEKHPKPTDVKIPAAEPSTPQQPSMEVGPEPAWQKFTTQLGFGPAVPPSRQTAPAKSEGLEIKLGQKVVLIVGIVVMVFAVGYFLKYSFEQGWVGPAGRVASAFFWGIVLLLAGDRFRRKDFSIFGLCLAGGGIAVLYFASYAGFQIYDLFSQALAFGIMVLVTLLACTLAVVYDNRWLAVLGLIGGFLTPIFLSTGIDNQIALMSYITLLNLGLLGVAFHKRWGLLNGLGFFFTYLLYIAWHASHYSASKFWPAILFLNGFYLIYTLIPLAYHFFRKPEGKTGGFLIIVPNSFIAFGFSYGMIADRFNHEWAGIISIVYAAIFLLLATILYRLNKQQDNAFVILLAKASLFLIITIPIIFSQHWVTIFWLVQGLTLLWMGVRLERKSLIIGAAVLMGIGTVKFFFLDYILVFGFDPQDFAIYNSYTHMLLERVVTSLMVLTTLFGFSHLARKYQEKGMSAMLEVLNILSTIVFGIMLFIILNIETVCFFNDALSTAKVAAVSVLWTLFSVGLMLKGFRDNSQVYRLISMVLFVITLLKVFLMDMAEVSTPYRIISFFVLGIVLMGVSYQYYRYRDTIIDTLSDKEKEEPIE